MFREVGLHSVMPRSFLHEFASPLEANQKDYLEAWLGGWLNSHPEQKSQLTTQDISTLKQLLDPANPHYVFDRDDLYGIQVETIYAGIVPM
jgi:hypothetical protein